jgi:hypothetical protein
LRATPVFTLRAAMASNSIYGPCLRSLRSRSLYINSAIASNNLCIVPSGCTATYGPLFRSSASSRLTLARSFAACSRRSAGLAPESKPQQEEKLEVRPEPQDSTVVRIAKQLRKHAAAQTETYVAYGGTRELFRECAKHATYTVPQASQKDAEIPKTAEGEDIGVGGGWWHDGTLEATLTLVSDTESTFGTTYCYVLLRYWIS